MPPIGAGCHELRIVDRDHTWRIVYHIAADAVVILDVFSKKTPATPPTVAAACRKRLEAFQTLSKKKDSSAKRKT
jgi:phage-related protein